MRKKQLLWLLLLSFLSVTIQQKALAQARKINGTVQDEKGNPVTGASVTAAKTTTVTDPQGNFSISITPTAKTLTISSVGFITKDVTIGPKTVFNIALRSDTANLSDVVVVAYGQQKKESVTAAISTVSSKEIVQAPVANISNALAGRLPGLISVQSTGKPGSDAATLYIRGVGTYTGNTAPLVMVDGVVRDSYNDIDPNEVENISILKDASATAVFGVRGANGVILINTKRGKEGAPKVSATVQTAATQFSNLPKYVNSYQYATLRNEQVFETFWQQHANDANVAGQANGWANFVAARNTGYKPTYSDNDLKYYQNAHTPKLADGTPNPYYDPYFHPDVDWQSLLFKTSAPQTQANVNITGGTKGVKYFLSAGYLTQGGMFKTDYMPYSSQMDYRKDRYNVRGNFDFDVNENLKISIDLGTQFVQISGMSNDGYNYQKNLLWTNPLSSPGYIDGKFTFIWNQNAEQFNPLYSLVKENAYNLNNNSTLNSAITITHKLDFITKGLSVSARGAYDSYFSSTSAGQSYPVFYDVRPNPNGDLLNPIWVRMNDPSPSTIGANYYSGKWRKWYAEFRFNYNRTFGNHAITALAMGNLEKKFDPTLAYDLPHAYEGVVGRVTYAYKGKYLAEYDLGINGSENFPPGKRFGLMPAYSLGWVVSNEKFFPKTNYINFLKIRGSIGRVGNDVVGGQRYLYLPNVWTYGNAFNQGYNYGIAGSNRSKLQAAWENTLGNPDLTWETAEKSNIGFDAKLLHSKLTITYDHYLENRTGILSQRGTIPGIVGANMPYFNIGKVRNWGNELEVTYRDNVKRDFTYFVKANISNNENIIVFRDEPITPGLEYQAQTGKPINQGSYLQDDGLYTSWSQLYAVDGSGNPILSQPVLAKGKDGKPYTNAAGNPVYEKDLSFAGVPLQPGDIKMKDVNGDGVIDAKDYVRSGKTSIPEFTYGISFGFSYKNFDVSVLLQGAAGVASDAMPSTDLHFHGVTEALFQVDWNRFTLDRYAAGQKIDFPIAAYNQQAYQNTYFHENTSYVRLKNIEIGYRIQQKLLKRLGIASTRIYVNGYNLHTWSKNSIWGDPENLGYMGYPLTKTFNAGINVNF